MTRSYKRLEDKIEGTVPVVGMGATIHVDRYVVPCTVAYVGTTDRRTPMVAVQVDKTGDGEFFRDADGEVFAYTYRKRGGWRQYGYGYKTGPWLELGVRRCMRFTDEDAVEDAVESYGDAEETPAERLRRLMR